MSLATWNEGQTPATILDDLAPIQREYTFGGEALAAPDAEPILVTADRFDWTVVTVRRDWSRVFA